MWFLLIVGITTFLAVLYSLTPWLIRCFVYAKYHDEYKDSDNNNTTLLIDQAGKDFIVFIISKWHDKDCLSMEHVCLTRRQTQQLIGHLNYCLYVDDWPDIRRMDT